MEHVGRVDQVNNIALIEAALDVYLYTVERIKIVFVFKLVFIRKYLATQIDTGIGIILVWRPK